MFIIAVVVEMFLLFLLLFLLLLLLVRSGLVPSLFEFVLSLLVS